MSRVDLHIHSTASDGRHNPAEVVRMGAEAGLSFMALADHDTVDGIPPALEAAKAFPSLRVIPAVEINTDVPKGEIHVLGYFIDYTDSHLQDTLEQMRNSRIERAQGMIEKLKKLGMPIEWERVKEIAGPGSIGRPHIAQALLEKGYISTIKEAFNKYIGWGGPAYVARKKMTPVEAVELILKTNGLAVLAHPLTITEPEAAIAELKAAGIVGLEAYYNNYTNDETRRCLNLARKYGLIAVGGSDYHGLDENAETAIGGANVPVEAATRLIALAEQRLDPPLQ
ncbi:MAG: PHP domain-containing protein [Chloroflexi bacterium]|nr:PHP domain-containing protein [Chloroflexota bacterium]